MIIEKSLGTIENHIMRQQYSKFYFCSSFLMYIISYLYLNWILFVLLIVRLVVLFGPPNLSSMFFRLNILIDSGFRIPPFFAFYGYF
jgi:hypothetical protein